MNYFWVNQKHTYSSQVSGGYMFSPKLNEMGQHIHLCDSRRGLAPGAIFHLCVNALPKVVGAIKALFCEYSNPSNFSSASQNASAASWRIGVEYKGFYAPLNSACLL